MLKKVKGLGHNNLSGITSWLALYLHCGLYNFLYTSHSWQLYYMFVRLWMLILSFIQIDNQWTAIKNLFSWTNILSWVATVDVLKLTVDLMVLCLTICNELVVSQGEEDSVWRQWLWQYIGNKTNLVKAHIPVPTPESKYWFLKLDGCLPASWQLKPFI